MAYLPLNDLPYAPVGAMMIEDGDPLASLMISAYVPMGAMVIEDDDPLAP
jgi:hypothetical protein